MAATALALAAFGGAIAQADSVPIITSPLTGTIPYNQPFSYQITATNSPTSYGTNGLVPGTTFNSTTGLITSGTAATGLANWGQTLTIQILATNGAGTATANLVLLVGGPAPTVGGAGQASGSPGQAFSYQVSATTMDAAYSPSYTATGLPPGLSINPSNGLISGTPTASGVYSVTLQATNEFGSGSGTVSITIGASAVTSNLTATVTIGQNFTYQITGSNSPIVYAASNLPTGLTVNSTTGVISGVTTAAAGTYPVTISAGNSTGTGLATLTLTLAVAPVPAITSSLAVQIYTGQPFSYQITASGSPTSFGATSLPAGLTFNSATGVISSNGVADNDPNWGGTYSVPISASNAAGTGTATLVLTVWGQAPYLTQTSASGYTGAAFSYQLVAQNMAAAYSPVYRMTGLPAGLSVNASTGLITGTITAPAGIYYPVVYLNNEFSGTDGGFIFYVDLPAVTSALNATATVGRPFTYQITGSYNPTYYSASGLPAGLTINESTGVISGTPTGTGGTYNVIVSVNNSTGGSNATVVLTVTAGTTPVITSPLSATIPYGLAFTYQIQATNSPTSFASSGLPAGLTLNPTSGLISSGGQPTYYSNWGSTYSVTISATNSSGTNSSTVVLTVGGEVSVISSSLAVSAIAGQSFTYQATATGRPTDYVASGLPSGLTLNSYTGLISGTMNVSPGVYTATLSVFCAYGWTSSYLVITVGAVPGNRPTITSSLSANAYSGLTFFYQIAASNTPTSFAASGLPAGLALDPLSGAISGTLSAPSGVYVVSITATNPVGTGSASLSITVGVLAPPVVTSAKTANANVGSSFGYQITASSSGLYFAATGLPPGLSLNTVSGVISGTPQTTGVYSAAVTAINQIGQSSQTLTITVSAAIAAQAPAITSPATANAWIGEVFSYQITGSNAPTSYTAGGLPAGLTLNASTGAISGTPSGSAGTFAVTISVANGAGSATGTVTITVQSAAVTSYTPLAISTYAGATANGSANGTAAVARFSNPTGVAVDGSGNVYVADSGNDLIRLITPAGVVSTLAGSAGSPGSANGTGTAAQFSNPTAVAVDASGNVYVADTGNSVIREISPTGVVTTLAGSVGSQGSADGTGTAARFYNPMGVAVDPSGNVYVADTGNNTIREISPGGGVTTLAGQATNFGSFDGTGSTARFFSPTGVAVDGFGNVFVADNYNDTVREISAAGVVTTLAGSVGNPGYADGTGTTSQFSGPTDVAVDSSGNVYVADYDNETIREISPAGAVTTLAGSPGNAGSANGTGSVARFDEPSGIAVTPNGTVYVAEAYNNDIRIGALLIAPPSITTQPQSVTVAPGGSTSLNVSASGSSLSYQWFLNGTAISGQTGSTLTISSAQTSDAGSYTVIVSNGAGNVTSAAATVTVSSGGSGSGSSGGNSGGGSGGGGGGGGSPSGWFYALLAGAAAIRLLPRSREAGSR